MEVVVGLVRRRAILDWWDTAPWRAKIFERGAHPAHIFFFWRDFNPSEHHQQESSSRGEGGIYCVGTRAVVLERSFFANMTTHRHHRDVLLSASSHAEDEGGRQQVPETTFEYYSDGILATAFLIIAILAAKR